MSDRVLVLNAGSSSLKYSLVDAFSGEALARGSVERIGERSGIVRHAGPAGTQRAERRVGSYDEALRAVLDAFSEQGPALADADVTAVGHRVVHGGARFADPAPVDDALLAEVEQLIPLAPLHNPANLEGMRVARRIFPDLPHVAVFDTAFHQTLPEHAFTYAVPTSWRDEHHIRRYGFHGTSHAFVSRQAARLVGRKPEDANVIVLHLGNGASATAVEGGRSVDTSMGLTPLEGLVMGTRSGDLDPAIHGHLAREVGWSVEEVDRVLNRESGLLGLAGENDFRELERLVAERDERARLAFDVYCYRLRKYVGAYYAVLGTVDAIAFTAGVGENAPHVRATALDGLEALGIRLDPSRNEAAGDPATALGDGAGWLVSADDSRVAVLVVPTNEEWEIAQQALAVVRG